MTKGQSDFVILSSLGIRASSIYRHPLRIGRTHFRANDECNADCNQEKREELPARHSGDQRGIRFAEIFHHDSEDCVTDEKEAGQHAIWLAHARSHKPQNAKQDNPLEERFVELRRVPRCQDRPKSFSDGRFVMNGGRSESTRLNSSHSSISYAVFCLKKKKKKK